MKKQRSKISCYCPCNKLKTKEDEIGIALKPGHAKLARADLK